MLIERCVGRRSDPETGKIYHLKFNPPPEDPAVQARLVHRSDDTEEAMVKRIEQYKKNVDAIKGYYKDITKVRPAGPCMGGGGSGNLAGDPARAAAR